MKPLAAKRARIEESAATRDLTPCEQRRLGRLQKAHGRLVRGLATAPFETAVERGVIDAVAPLDFDDPKSLAARTAQAEKIAAAYGMAVSPLRPAEARALEARLDGTAPEALPDALADLRAGFGDAALAEVARGLETERPHLAVALRLAEERPDLAADILEGGRRLKQAVADGKADTMRPTDDEMQAASARVYGSETALQDHPAEAEAAAALYALRTANTTQPGFQPAVFEQAMRDVAPEGALIDEFGTLGVPTVGADQLDAEAAPADAAGDQIIRLPAPRFLTREEIQELVEGVPTFEPIPDPRRVSLGLEPGQLSPISSANILEHQLETGVISKAEFDEGMARIRGTEESRRAEEDQKRRLAALQAQAGADMFAPETGRPDIAPAPDKQLIRSRISKKLDEKQLATGELEIDSTLEEHTHRNVFNKCAISPPQRIEGGKRDGQYVDCEGIEWSLDGDIFDFHGKSEGNQTFRAPDPDRPGGGFQCTYSPKGKLIDEGKHMGTYDYVAPDGAGAIGKHIMVDVVKHAINPNYAGKLTTVYCK